MSHHLFSVEKDSVDQTIIVRAQQNNSGAAPGNVKTGLVFNSAGLVCYYKRGTTGAVTQVTLVSTTVTGAHTDGGFIELGANMPGEYKVDLPDAIFATGVERVKVTISGVSDLQPISIDIDLVEKVNVTNGVLQSNLMQVNSSTNLLTKFANGLDEIVIGSAVTGTLTTTQMTTNLTEATNDHYKDGAVIWTSGALKGQRKKITAYNGSTKMLTFEQATEAPANGDGFIIV